MSKLSNFKYAPIALAVFLAACGGGGDSSVGGNVQISNSINLKDTVEVEAGKNLAISSNVNVLRGSVSTHTWTIAQINGETVTDTNKPTIVDANCATASKRAGAPASGGAVGINGSSNCQTSIVIPSTAKSGEWSVKSTAVSGDGAASTAGFTLKIKVAPVTVSGFNLLIPNKPQIQNLGELATLAASYSVANDVKVDSVKYNWTQISGETVNIAGATTSMPSFYPKSYGEYVFRVAVTATINGKTETQEGDIVLSVAEPEAQTYFTVDSGAVQVGKTDSVVTLKGTVGGNAPAGSLAYEWSQVSGPVQAQIANINSLEASFIPKVSGTYVFQLKASNNKGFKIATTTVGVDEAVSTTPFFAVSAGNAQLVETNTPVLLKGEVAAGNPAPGNITYQWVQTSGPVVTLSNPNTLNASFIVTTAGNYEFRLTATSGNTTKVSNTSVVARVVTPVGNTVTTGNTGGNSTNTNGNATFGPSTQ